MTFDQHFYPVGAFDKAGNTCERYNQSVNQRKLGRPEKKEVFSD